MKPLLEVTANEEAMACKESELKSLRETLLQKECALSDYIIRIEQVWSWLYVTGGKRDVFFCFFISAYRRVLRVF